jgi:hypothetical protein
MDAARRGHADALIITGSATGMAADLDEVARVKEFLPDVPVLVGSGVDLDSMAKVLEVADGCIVGTALKEQGRIDLPVDPGRVRAMADVAERLAPRIFPERAHFAEERHPSFHPEGGREPEDRFGEGPEAIPPEEPEDRHERGFRDIPAEIPVPEPAWVSSPPGEDPASASAGDPAHPESREVPGNGPPQVAVQFGRGPVRKRRR